MKRTIKKEYIIFAIMTPITILVLAVMAFIYSSYMLSIFEEETAQTLDEITTQSVQLLQKQIYGEGATLRGIAEIVGENSVLDNEELFTNLSSIAKHNGFQTMGIVDPSGLAKLTSGQQVDVSDRDYFKSAMRGLTTLSETIESRISGTSSNVYSTPIYCDSHISGVLIASHLASSYEQSMEISSFGGEGYAYIVRSNGDVVIGSPNAKSIEGMKNIFDPLINSGERNEAARLEIMDDFSNGKNGVARVTTTSDKFVDYKMLGVNDWYLYSVIPASIMQRQSSKAMTSTYILCASVVILLGVVMRYLASTKRKNRLEIRNLAFVDQITGGNNLNRFKQLVLELIEKYGDDMRYAIVVFDVDKFRYVNHMFGYETGNVVLIRISDFFKDNLGEDEAFARVSNDKFVILMSFDKHNNLIQRLDRLCEKFREKGCTGACNYEIHLSMGVYEIEDYRMNIDIMMDKASIPQKESKGDNKTTYSFYDDTIKGRMQREFDIENKMRKSLEDGEFEAYYQPKYSVKTKKLVGAEALVRWRDPVIGLVPPDDFIPLFERNGFVVKLDIFMFESVCKQIRSWMDSGLPFVPVSVNLSRLHLYNPNFINDYTEIADNYEIPYRYLELEVTESALFEDKKHMLALMDELHQVGFCVSMDDFGSGYSSLNMLKDIPIDVLKIDREFFSDTSNHEKGKRIIKLIVEFAQTMHIEVVAEGVETKSQIEFLAEIGCDTAQGYFFSKPLKSSDYEKILQEEGAK